MNEIENFDWGADPEEEDPRYKEVDPLPNMTPEQEEHMHDTILQERLRSIMPDMAGEILEKHVSPTGMKLTEIDAPQEMYEEHVVSEKFVKNPDEWRRAGFHFAEDYWVTRDDYPELGMQCMTYELGYPTKEGLRLETVKERMIDSDLYMKERIFRTAPEYVSSVADEVIPRGEKRIKHYRKYVLDQARNSPNPYRAANAVKYMQMDIDVNNVTIDPDIRDRYKDADEETKAIFMDAATIIEFRHPELTYERKMHWLDTIEETWAIISGERPETVLTKTVEKLLTYDRGLAEIEKFKKQRVDLTAYEDDGTAEDDYEFDDE